MDDKTERSRSPLRVFRLKWMEKERRLPLKSNGDLQIDAKKISVKGSDGISMKGKEFKVKTDAALRSRLEPLVSLRLVLAVISKVELPWISRGHCQSRLRLVSVILLHWCDRRLK